MVTLYKKQGEVADNVKTRNTFPSKKNRL